MLRSDFSYALPSELIAQEPRPRGRSRMMLIDREGSLSHHSFSEIADLLDPRSLLVLNDTRVIPARLFADPRGQMKGRIEVLLTRRLDERTWESWCRPARRLRAGDPLRFSAELTAVVMGRSDDGSVIVRFEGSAGEIAAAIERTGVPPLPPYIARTVPRDSDRESYQTVYANAPGAIAAPTAGLHFTNEILDAIRARGVDIVQVTLHVGIGTFKPVKVDDIAEHRMDEERYEIAPDAARRINAALADGRPIVAVGTTSVRTLESAIAAGEGTIRPGAGATSLFITPGYRFRAVDRLLTNFHLPESTLIMLVSAFAGIDVVRRAYAAAIAEKYFFYSYGDCMLIDRSHESPRPRVQ